MKQKVTSIFLLAVLVLSLLVGCSTDEGNSSNYPDDSPSSVSSGIVESPQSTDSVEQSSADADDSGVEAEDPSGSNGQSNMTGQEIDQPVSSTLPTEIAAATSFSLSDVKPYDIAPFTAWLEGAVRDTVQMVETGSYQELVERELPIWHRTGTILRRDLWRVFPQWKEEFFQDFSQQEVEEFLTSAVGYPLENNKRLPSVTANAFYHFCALGYRWSWWPRPAPAPAGPPQPPGQWQSAAAAPGRDWHHLR